MRRWLPIGALLLCFVATGCLRADVDVEVRDDGSGQVQVEVFPDSNVQSLLVGADLDDLVDGAFRGQADVELESIRSGDRAGYRLTVPFGDYQTLSDVLVAGGTVAGQQVALFSSFNLTERVSGGWQLDATVNPASQILVDAPDGAAPSELGRLIEAAAGGTGTGLNLTIALPGKVTASNADSVDGGSAKWNLNQPDAPGVLMMFTEPTPLLDPLQMVLIGTGAAVLLGVILALWGAGSSSRRRVSRRSAPSTSGEAQSQTAWAERSASPPAAEGTRSPTLPAMEPAASVDRRGAVESGSPLANPSPSAQPLPGWYPDPDDAGGHRWWDGSNWTEHRR